MDNLTWFDHRCQRHCVAGAAAGNEHAAHSFFLSMTLMLCQFVLVTLEVDGADAHAFKRVVQSAHQAFDVANTVFFHVGERHFDAFRVILDSAMECTETSLCPTEYLFGMRLEALSFVFHFWNEGDVVF